MKGTRHEGQLLMRQLALIPGFTAKYPDRITRSEISRLRELVAGNPRITQALRNKSDPAYAEVRWAIDRLTYFATEHPQDDQGDAAPWTSGRLVEMDHPISDLTPEEAAARLGWAQTQPEYLAARDPAHPEYATYRRQEALIAERSNLAPESAGPTLEPSKPGTAPAVTHEGRIAELKRDPAYADSRDSNHRAAVEAVTRAYQAAFPEAGVAAAPAGGMHQAAVATPAERIREIQAHPGYRDGRHPEHAAKVSEMTAVYQAAYPAPGTPGEPPAQS